MVGSFGTNVPSHMGTLAPPGEYDWTCASFGPSESSVQTANRSVQPFAQLTAKCRQVYRRLLANTIEIVHIAAIWQIQLNSCFLQPTQVHNPNSKSVGWAVSAQLTAESPYTLQWATVSPKISVSHGGIWTPSNTWFLGPIWAKLAQMGPRNHVLGGVQIPPWETEILGETVAHCKVEPIVMPFGLLAQPTTQTASRSVLPFV